MNKVLIFIIFGITFPWTLWGDVALYEKEFARHLELRIESIADFRQKLIDVYVGSDSSQVEKRLRSEIEEYSNVPFFQVEVIGDSFHATRRYVLEDEVVIMVVIFDFSQGQIQRVVFMPTYVN